MAEFLSKENVKEIFCEFCNEAGETFICVGTYDCGFLKRIDDEPATDVAEVKRGEWVWKEKIEPQAINRLYCSCCGNECLGRGMYYIKSSFCPSCGAKMKG